MSAYGISATISASGASANIGANTSRVSASLPA